MPDTYNDRLFHGNRARRFLHERRFWWLIDRLRRLHISRAAVIEIGCYDAKTISYLERGGIAVTRYVGYEADADVFARAQPQLGLAPRNHTGEIERSIGYRSVGHLRRRHLHGNPRAPARRSG